MTKHEFLAKLTAELAKNKTAEAADIVKEYEQHFAFKLADGYCEEEIATKLGDPVQLAAQFASCDVDQSHNQKSIVTRIGLFFADLFTGIFFLLLAVWGLIMAAFSLACAVTALCLLGGINLYALIPPMPYWCGAVFGVSILALAILTAAGCVYYAAFLWQLTHAYGRFRHNTLALSTGKVMLPALSITPQLAPKTNRHIRSAVLITLAIFSTCFVLGMIVSMLSAGALEFWHAWGWFGYTGAF